MLPDFKKNIKRKKSAKSFLFHVIGLLAVALLIFLAIANMRMHKKKQEFLAQVSDLKNQIESIQKRNDNLKEGIANSDDDTYIEKVAREELDLQKPGEKAVSFIMPEPKAQVTVDVNQPSVQRWWTGIWNWITGL